MVSFIKKALAIGVLLAPLCANADIFYTLVGYECGSDRLTLTYDGAYNEEGGNMLANKRDTQLEPHSLLTIESTDKYARIVDTAVHKAECKLSDGVYQIEIAPYPGNSNILGLCGAWVGARAKVTKGDMTLYDRVFADDCHQRFNKDLWIEGKQEVIITRVIFTPNKDEPHIIVIPYQDFYK
ncbi:MAG: hypothetical protein LBF86_02885 [Helicobacteraceae bacterium]|jgi:hypothetical protein|nr:hypothetical protein [Helicobacteraceae bacterium]